MACTRRPEGTSAELIFTGGDWPARSARRQQLPRRAKLSYPLGSSFIREADVALDFSGRHAEADAIRFSSSKHEMAAFYKLSLEGG